MSLPDSATPTPAIHQPLTIDVRGRRTERWLGALAVLALAIAARLLDLSPLAAAVLFFSACSLVVAGLWRQGWLGGAHRLTGVRWLSDGSWMLTDAGLVNLPAALSPQSRVGSRWLWLRWHIEAGGPRRRSMLLLQGDVEDGDLRRLGVRLRLESVCRQPLRARVLGA
ncbi:MAG TPA: hypothetical protein VGE08_23310 [Steroidobacter sp.]|uniref:hypothetical protein n=1 Tax=Steroidobacter sp. TaxID=1978227 RepID=UPI002ED9D252